MDTPASANEKQVGGTHYAMGGKTQHWDYAIQALGNRYLEGNITKYVMRHRKKRGREDLEKALHYLEKLVESYNNGSIKAMPLHQRQMQTFDVHAMVVSNGLNTSESLVVSIIAGWRGLADLVVVRRHIFDLLTQDDHNSHLQQAIKAGAKPGDYIADNGACDPIGDKGATSAASQD